MFMFNFEVNYSKHTIERNIAKHLTEHHRALPDTYGMKASELVELMNNWKRNYDA